MNEKELYDRVIEDIKHRKERISKGLINSIPWGFPKFSKYVVGLEKKKIYLVTAGPKVGKSKLANNMWIYNAYDYIIENKLSTNLKVKYYCLEESKEVLIAQFMCYTLFTKSKGTIVVDPVQLMSTEKELPIEILDEIEKHKDYIQDFLARVEYIEDVSHPFGMYNDLVKYAKANGTQTTKKVAWRDAEIDDVYIPNDPEELVLIVIDHISLLTHKTGENTGLAIIELSKYLVKLRNKYGYSSLIIQQQALAQTSIEGLKFNQGEPTIAGLGDSKLTSRDIDISFGLYSPYEHKIEEYNGYDIKFYKDNIRFLSVLSSRHGGAGTKIALFFHGGINYFCELPKPGTPEEQKMKTKITNVRNNQLK